MAIVAHTPYTGNTDCGRTNEYLCDGHGLPEAERTNRYLTDGHGLTTLCAGHNCPADPELATEYMNTIRLNYERQHPISDGRTKGCVTHEQIYVSPTEEDNVPAEERMEMMKELIERTALKDFPCIYVPHDNTEDKHGHISLCPYSVDGTHKLGLNNAMLNDLRREMDRICVEHGYSIVENPELWADKEYRDWFFAVKDEGIVKIHPPKDQSMATYKQDRKRARTYSASKQSQALRQEKQAQLYKNLTKGYTPESAHLYHTSSYFYNPHDPNKELHVKKIMADGREAGDMEMAAASLFVWAYGARKEIDRRKLKGATGLQKRLEALSNKALSAADLVRNLDIKTHGELVGHIKEVGQDIADLRKDIKRQDTIMEKMSDVMAHIDRWENGKDTEALEWLKAHHCSGQDQIEDAKKRYARATARKATNEALLKERSTEYRHLKEAESVIHPASCEDVWNDYLEQMFTKELVKKIGYVDGDKLKEQAYAMGKVAGLTKEEVDAYFLKAQKIAQKTTWVEYRGFMRLTYTRDGNGAVSVVWDEIRDRYREIRELRDMSRHMPVFGPVSFVVAMSVAFYAGWKESEKKSEIEALVHEAEIIGEYVKDERMRQREALEKEKAYYEASIVNASASEVDAALVRFYERAARITGRMDVEMEIMSMRKAGAFDEMIADAVRRKINRELNLAEIEPVQDDQEINKPKRNEFFEEAEYHELF